MPTFAADLVLDLGRRSERRHQLADLVLDLGGSGDHRPSSPTWLLDVDRVTVRPTCTDSGSAAQPLA